MEIIYLPHKQIDKRKWDQMISISRNRMPYVFSWYLDVVTERWDALVTAEYEYLFPLPVFRKFGFQYLMQPFYMQQGGIYSPHEVTQQVIREFLTAIPQRFRYIQLNLNVGNRAISIPKFELRERRTHHLALNKPYDQLFSEMKPSKRNKIRRAMKQDLNLIKRLQPGQMVKFWREHVGTYLPEMDTKAYDRLLELLHVLYRHKKLYTVGAYDEQQEMVAMAAFIRDRHYYIYFMSAATPDGKKMAAPSLLIDEFLHDHAPARQQLDFEGSEVPSIAKFFKSFGAEEVIYLQAFANKLPLYLRWLKK